MKNCGFNVQQQPKSLTVQQKCHKVTSRPLLAWNQLGISLSAAVLCASDRYVFVLLGSVWCRECPRRALKSTIQDPKCQSTSPQPFRATKPSDSTKMASLAFLCSSRLLINDHIQRLYGTWQPYESFFLKGLMRKNTHCIGGCGRAFCKCV